MFTIACRRFSPPMTSPFLGKLVLACRHGEYVKRTNEVFPQGNTKRKLNGTDCGSCYLQTVEAIVFRLWKLLSSDRGSISGKKRLRIKFGMTEAIFYPLKTNLLRFQDGENKKTVKSSRTVQ